MVEVTVALIASVPITIGAVVALRRMPSTAKANAVRLQTSNGQTVGEMVEETHHDVKEIRTWLVDHMRDNERHKV